MPVHLPTDDEPNTKSQVQSPNVTSHNNNINYYYYYYHYYYNDAAAALKDRQQGNGLNWVEHRGEKKIPE